MSAGHRVRLHQQIGVRKEAGYGVQARQIAAELAVHFVRGHDAGRAVTYLHYAGRMPCSAVPIRRRSPTAALDLLATLPEGQERLQHELLVQTTLGLVLSVAKGYAAPEVERSLTRARELCQLVGDAPQLGLVLWDYIAFISYKRSIAQRRSWQRSFSVWPSTPPRLPCFWWRTRAGSAIMGAGHLTAAREHLVPELPRVEAQRRQRRPSITVDPGVLRLVYTAYILWGLGYADAALQRLQAMFTLAQGWPIPCEAVAQGVQLVFSSSVETSQTPRRGRSRADPGDRTGISLLDGGRRHPAGLGARRAGTSGGGHLPHAAGAGSLRSHRGEVLSAILAGHAGRGVWPGRAGGRGLRALDEALAHVDKTGERFWEAELYRLQGELLDPRYRAGQGTHRCSGTIDHGRGRNALCASPDIARRQQARAWELRAPRA